MPCLVCGKNVSNPNQKFCKYCSIRFNTDERNALIGINEGKFNLSLANELLKLKKEGMELENIANKVSLLNDYPDISPELIDPIIRFLINHEADDTLESYQNFLKGVKIKFCEVCNEEFIEPKNVNGQTICKTCRKKYTPAEIMVLKGIKEGKYNQNTAINAYTYRKMGLTNKEIAKKLNISNNLVKPVIDLLLPVAFGGENKNRFNDSNKSKPKNKNKYNELYKSKPKKFCKYCGKEFSPKSESNGLFCSDCNRKYDYSDLLLFIDIKEGKYSFKLASEIFKLQKNGYSNENIANKLHIPQDLIDKILNHYGFYGQEFTDSNLINCSVCGNLFVKARGTSNQQYCPKCKEEFKSNERRVLAGINEGIYNKNLAIKIKTSLEKGESKASIIKRFKLPNTSVIDPIIKYLYDDEIPDFMNNKLISPNLSKNFFITDCSDNKTNIILKGTISNEFAIDFMNSISKINLSIKEIIFKEKDRGIEFYANFDVEDSSLDKLFSELISLGFK